MIIRDLGASLGLVLMSVSALMKAEKHKPFQAFSVLVIGVIFLIGGLGDCEAQETIWDITVKQQNEIIEDTTREIERNPRNVEAYFNRGEAHRLIEQYEQAISDFNKAIQINPKYARAFEGRADAHLGLAYRDLNKINQAEIDEANADLKKAEEIDPTIFNDHKNRGLGYISKTTNEFIYPAMSMLMRHRYGDLVLGKTTIKQVIQMLEPWFGGPQKISKKDKPVYTGAIGEVIKRIKYTYNPWDAGNLILAFDKAKILLAIIDFLPENLDIETDIGKQNKQKITDMMKHYHFVETARDEEKGTITMQGKISPCVIAQIHMLIESEDLPFIYIEYYFTCPTK